MARVTQCSLSLILSNHLAEIAESERLVFWLSAQHLTRVLLPGCYAWLTTVALPIWEAEDFAAAGLAVLAIGALGWGVLQVEVRPKLSRRIGILGFFSLCLGAWIVAVLNTGSLQRLPLRAGLGAVAWGLLAVGWGGVADGQLNRHRGVRSDSQAPLMPRRRMPRLFWLAVSVVVAVALALPVTAWWIADPVDALLGHALAAAGCISLVGVGLRVAVGRPSVRGARVGLGSAVSLILWIGLGVLLSRGSGGLR